MAAGLLVIGSRAERQVEMFEDGINSLTFAPGDADGLAAHIGTVLDDRGLCRRLAESGRQLIAERFLFRRMIDEMEAFLGRVAESSREKAC